MSASIITDPSSKGAFRKVIGQGFSIFTDYEGKSAQIWHGHGSFLKK